jgi:hypothetical protein
MGWVDGQGKDVQAHICRSFGAGVIIVIGDDKLHSAMQVSFQVGLTLFRAYAHIPVCFAVTFVCCA